MPMPSPPPVIELPGCKSSSQRALLLAALAAGESTLRGLSDGADSAELQRALLQLGWDIRHHVDGSFGIIGSDGPLATAVKHLEIGEGGSTLRFLAPILSAGSCDLQLHLAPALARRPQQDLLTILERLGAKAHLTGEDLHLHSLGWITTELSVPTACSSQFLTGVLLAAGRTPMSYHLEAPPVSAGYLDLTVDLLHAFRGKDALQTRGLQWQQHAGFGQGQTFDIPADASAMVFFAVAAVLTGKTVRFARPWHQLHPDGAVLRFLAESDLLHQPDATTLTPGRPPQFLHEPLPFDLQESPDSGPALAVLAALLPGGIRFLHPDRLRGKESDRLDGMARLAALGGAAAVSQSDGSLRIAPARTLGQPPPAPQQPFQTCQDHRLAMAAGIAELVWGEIVLDDPAVVAKSFPAFWEQRDRLR